MLQRDKEGLQENNIKQNNDQIAFLSLNFKWRVEVTTMYKDPLLAELII